MNKVEHIGIAVKSLELSIPLFEKLLNTQCYKTEPVTSENVNTAFFKKGETKTIRFSLTVDDLRFYDKKLNYIYEPGEFKIMIGPNSRDVKEVNFKLK